jgi:plastocyanin
MKQRHHRVLRLVTAFALVAGAAGAEGVIEGRVVYTGPAKRNPLIRMGADPNCLEINAGKKVQQLYVDLDDDGSINNVFVHITNDVAYSGGPPSEPVVIEQEGCIYRPRILGAMVGQELLVRNLDSTLHNIHSRSGEGNSFNVGQPKAGMEFTYELKKEEVMLPLKCDVHPWMQGYVGVKTHPYLAVTRDDGSFRIEGVPAGTYTLEAWQEKLGTLQQQVTVEDGQTATVELAFAEPGS